MDALPIDADPPTRSPHTLLAVVILFALLAATIITVVLVAPR